jgi:succinoglycan biosynthesis transport protein ExoP
MSVLSILAGTIRALVLAAATGVAAFGLLVVFQPFGRAVTEPAAVTVSGSPAATALQRQIEALRIDLRDAEAARDAAKASALAAPSPAAASRGQYEAQIAAATERRDLALRHAEAIRASLEAGVTPSSLASIRDSVVIGQLLTQQVTLDAQIAVEGARLRANHPTMRALNAQRTALAGQIRQEASSIAAALEGEARIDDAQIALLEAELPKLLEATPAPADTSGLELRTVTLRAELDSLVDAYFNIPPATAATAQPATIDPLNASNLAVVGVAAVAALLFQILLAARRRRPEPAEPAETDVAAWAEDRDPEFGLEEPEPLRKAS